MTSKYPYVRLPGAKTHYSSLIPYLHKLCAYKIGRKKMLGGKTAHAKRKTHKTT